MMSDYAVLGLLAMLGPVLVIGILANLVLWFGDRPLPYNEEEYEREQRRDRLHLERRRRREARHGA